MSFEKPNRKRVKHYHEPGDFHELTFSCYQRLPLLTNDVWRGWLARSIDQAATDHAFKIFAFVFMPEHVHLLVWPTRDDTAIDDLASFLAAVKRPVSRQVEEHLAASQKPLLKRLTVRTRPGVTAFRFWQEGAGYDRNLQTAKAVLSSIDYLHENPFRRKLVNDITRWKWSSIRWYASDGQIVEPDLPTIHRLPAELFDGSTDR